MKMVNRFQWQVFRQETLTPKPGYTEKNLDDLWDMNAQAIKNAIEKSGIDSKEIVGISFSGAGKGLYMVGYDGKPSYNGIMSTDTRAWEQMEKWYADGTNKKVYEKNISGNSGCAAGEPAGLVQG